MRGVTISTHGGGQDWGSEAMVPTLAGIAQVGAGWIAIHPYASIRANGDVRVRGLDPSAPPAWLTYPIEEAHRQGLKILIKPHLAYWGSPFSWRGEITFDSPEQWNRFWNGYSEWIVQLAAICKDADGFVVGTELDLTLGHESQWRGLIAEVRKRSTAALTYAANWTDYQQVGFWDSLDVIGIQAYFPVAERAGAEAEEIRAGWDRLMDELHRYAGKQNRNIVFTELGYNRSHDAAVRPWESRTDGPEAEALQATCLQIALEAIENEPRVLGGFLWKWFPEPRPVGRNFQLATPALKRVISAVWK